jgi:protein TonB
LAATTIKAGFADRLGSTLFVAVLVHGVIILGITFAPVPQREASDAPALNVTLLVDTNSADRAPTNADLLAARNQIGGGVNDSDRPTRTLNADHELSQIGEPLGADLEDADPLEAATPPEQLVTSGENENRIEAVPDTTDQPAPDPLSAAALIQQSAPDTLAAEIDDEVRNSTSDDGDTTAPSALESAQAAYMVTWRQRVERVGTANFPTDFLRGDLDSRRPLIEVAIGASGALEDIVLVRSSGDTRLDDAAMQILRLAAPFPPLPEAILAQYDVLRFKYEWYFSTGVR